MVRDTPTVATGGGITVSEVCALLPSLVAMMYTTPAAIAVIRPSASTVAIEGVDVLQEIARAVNTVPPTSRNVAIAVVEAPMTMVFAARVTLMDATGGGITITAIDALFPSLVAAMLEEPAPIAVTSPEESIVATEVTDDVQEMARPLSAFPFESRAVAFRRKCAPTIKVSEAGAISTVATGGGEIAIDTEPLFPSLDAVTTTTPAAIALITPD